MESTPHTLKYAAEGQPQSKKLKPKKSIHTHIHSSQPLRHSLVLQERCNQTGSLFSLSVIIRLVTPRTNPFTLTFTHHNRSDTPWYPKRGATRQGLCSGFWSSLIIGLATPRTPEKTPLPPAESHQRGPIPLRTASKVWILLGYF